MTAQPPCTDFSFRDIIIRYQKFWVFLQGYARNKLDPATNVNSRCHSVGLVDISSICSVSTYSKVTPFGTYTTHTYILPIHDTIIHINSCIDAFIAGFDDSPPQPAHSRCMCNQFNLVSFRSSLAVQCIQANCVGCVDTTQGGSRSPD